MPLRRLKIALLQARHDDDPMRDHEFRCFIDQTQLEDHQFVPHNLVEPLAWSSLNQYDALMVGGSGQFYVSKKNLPNHEAVLDLMREVATRGKPTFAACFGYQLIVEALGGKIIHDPDNTEVGTFELQLTEAGAEDPLFGQLPEVFLAQQGHKDQALCLPEGVENLASSERAVNQGFRIDSLPIWGAQFHPELTRETNIDRYNAYVESYAPDLSEAERDVERAKFGESKEAGQLLRRFLELVFG